MQTKHQNSVILRNSVCFSCFQYKLIFACVHVLNNYVYFDKISIYIPNDNYELRLNYSCVYSTYFDFQPIQQHLARKHQINVRPLGKRLRDPDKQVVAFPLKLSEQNYLLYYLLFFISQPISQCGILVTKIFFMLFTMNFVTENLRKCGEYIQFLGYLSFLKFLCFHGKTTFY